MLNGDSGAPVATTESPARKGRRVSAAALRRIREAQQRRWAQKRAEAAKSGGWRRSALLEQSRTAALDQHFGITHQPRLRKNAFG